MGSKQKGKSGSFPMAVRWITSDIINDIENKEKVDVSSTNAIFSCWTCYINKKPKINFKCKEICDIGQNKFWKVI